jgi:hypothetical protein
MKKIMFSDRYGLTQAVLDGKKTMTRRVDKRLNHPLVTDISEWGIGDKGKCYLAITYSTGLTEEVYPAYQIGEEVAIAQKYWDLRECNAFYEALQKADPTFPLECIKGEKGCDNKMFVKADWMPHRIRITNIKVERLQDITELECIREGVKIKKGNRNGERPFGVFTFEGWGDYSFTAREAFFALIDRISGRGTWQSNPWVFAYEFELIH